MDEEVFGASDHGVIYIAIVSLAAGAGSQCIAADPPEAVDADLKPYIAPTKAIDTKLLIAGSGTMGRIAQPLLKKFTDVNQLFEHEMSLPGSSEVPATLGTPRCNVGLMSRAMTAAERKAFHDRTGHDPLEFLIAGDAILILVNKDNPVDGITLQQLDALYGTDRRAGYKGEVKTWGDLGAKDDWAELPVDVFGILEENQGTVETFRRIVLKGGPINKSIQNIRIVETEFGKSVAKDRGGISYNIYHAPVDGAKAIGVATEAGKPFVKATTETIADGTYPLTRGLYLYLSDTSEPAACEFVRFVLSKDSQEIIARAGGAVSISAKAATRQLKEAKLAE